MKTKLLRRIRKRFVIKVINKNDLVFVKIFDLKNKQTLDVAYNTSVITDVLLAACYCKNRADKRRKRINFNKAFNK